ncbi:MAG: ribosomal RNA small subunit methyltransferase A [Bacilli bacterium]|nr:ribosomal RNA small subunit methyltransferase A [Bacilli bacterium]
MENSFHFKKSFGQNFLKDHNVIDNIIKSADIDKDTLVIEIGPGGGALTKELVPLCGRALLYEIDDRLEENLRNLLKEYDNFDLKICNFLDTDISKDLCEYKYPKLYLVANLPYYITTPIITKFIDDNVLPDKIVIMIQKEVASRFSAKINTKDYGSLTVFLNYYYDVVKLFDVSRNCFVPRPNVDSAVVEMKLKSKRKNVKDIDLFKKVVKDSFRYKRKNIKNNLKDYDLNIIERVLGKYDFDLNCRAENLSLDVFIDIVNEMKTYSNE